MMDPYTAAFLVVLGSYMLACIVVGYIAHGLAELICKYFFDGK